MKHILKLLVLLIILLGFSFGQWYNEALEEPDLSISKPQYEYVVFWQKWDDASHYMWVDGSQPKSKWEYHSKGFESLDGMLKWLNSSDWYYPEQKRVRLNDNQIIAIYDLTRAKKVHLKIVKTEMVEPYKVETKERKWTDVQWQLEE